MKVLWTVNLIPVDMAMELNITCEVLGGWVESMASQLTKNPNIELAVACKCDGNEKFKKTINNVTYYSMAYTPGTDIESVKSICKGIADDFKPDIIHIEGTEFMHARAMQTVAKDSNIPAVISMQGILNGQYDYQCGQLQIDDMMLSKSLTEFMAGWLLHFRKTRWYKPRMKGEKEIIENAEYILGRTTWDRAHTYAINPEARYFSCNRILRKPFYSHKWDYAEMEKHSIYVGNGYYALKGLHVLIKALPLLAREYTDIKVYVAGYEPFKDDDKRSFLKKGYGAYLKKLIDDSDVSKYIQFTGPLNAEQVAEKLASVNVYTLCSAIENSPNTLGEAMMVGTPCVAAYVGGVPDMATDGKDALFFRNDDHKILAWQIKRVFDNKDLAETLSQNGANRARATHNPETNADLLISAYEEILKEK